MLRNYPPYSVTHSAPLEPAPQPPLPAVTGALTSLSLHPSAVAAAPAVPTDISGSIGVCDAPVGVDAAAGGAGGGEQGGAQRALSSSSGEEDAAYGPPDEEYDDDLYADGYDPEDTFGD